MFFVMVASLFFGSCEHKAPAIKPPPHLELGQMIIFEGGDPSQTYIVLGYKSEVEAVTEKTYRGQEYVVFMYANNNRDLKQAVIHHNSIIKK